MSATDDGGGTGYSIDLEGGDDFDLDAMLSEQERIDAEAAAAGGEGGPPGGKKPAGAAGGDDETPAEKAQKLIISQQNAEIERLKGEASRRYSTEIEHPAPPTQPQVDVNKLKEELAQQMIVDPGGAALRIYEAAVKSAEQMVEARYKQSGMGLATLDVDQYRAARMASDGAFKESIQEWDDLVKQAAPGMTNLTAEQRRQQLDFLADTAFGRMERRKQQEGRRERNPPPYGGGETIASGTVRTTQYKGKPLNSVQQEVMRQAREAGITDAKRIKRMLDDAAEG